MSQQPEIAPYEGVDRRLAGRAPSLRVVDPVTGEDPRLVLIRARLRLGVKRGDLTEVARMQEILRNVQSGPA